MTVRIQTTHVGALPWAEPLDPDAVDFDARLAADVKAIVAQQRAVGIDVVNEGEHAKIHDWLSYLDTRFGGFEVGAPPEGKPMLQRGKDREVFAEFYAWASANKTMWFSEDKNRSMKREHWVATGPVTYVGQAELQREIDVLKAAAGDGPAFLSATAPASIEVYRSNAYYGSQEEYVYALAEALRVEYEAIAAAGLLVQVDDAWPPGLWERIGIQMGMPAFKAHCMMRVEALNHALRNIPVEQIRYHLCWGSWHGPHAFDIEMKDMVELMLAVKAKYYLFEAANARHEHEFAVWDTVKLPEGKVLVPGVVSHATDIVEHPDLVALRLTRFAERVGAQNVMGGTDCGLGGRVHPQIVWAKLRSMSEGAARASRALA